MIQEFPFKNELKNGIKTLTGDHLFKVNKRANKLNNKMKDVFHTTVAQALFLSLCSRIDTQLPVAFLTTRVRSPDVDNWHKMIRLLSYLKRYRYLSTTLKEESTNVSGWYANMAFAVHEDMKSHTGYTMTLGKGTILSKLIKQKLNTKKSTEAELLAADDVTVPLL